MDRIASNVEEQHFSVSDGGLEGVSDVHEKK